MRKYLGIIIIIICTILGAYGSILESYDTQYYEVKEKTLEPLGEIMEGTTITQPLPIIEYIKNIEIQMANYGKKVTSSINVSIVDDKNNQLFTTEVLGTDVIDNGYYNIEVRLKNSELKNLKLVIEGIDGQSGNACTIWTSQYEDELLRYNVNDAVKDRTLMFKINNQVNKFDNKFFVMLILLIIISSFIYLICSNILKDNIATCFVVISIVLGGICLIVSPIGQVPDEYMHFERAYSLATGHIWGEATNGTIGNYLPIELIKVSQMEGDGVCFPDEQMYLSSYKKLSREKISKELIFYNQANTLVYPIFSYLPQSIGILIGRLMNFDILKLFFLGRIGNFSAYVLIVYAAINIVNKRYKNILLCVGLLPMSIYLATSMSTDAIVNSLVLLYLAMIFNDNDSEEDRKYTFSRYIIGSIICMCKFTYLPIIFVHWIKDKDHYKRGIVFDVLIILIIILWNLNALINIPTMNPIDTNVSTVEQVKYILTNPMDYICILLKDFHNNFYVRIYQLNTVGWLTHTMNLLIPFTLVQMMIFTFSREEVEPNHSMSVLQIVIFSLAIIGSMILVVTALYLSWTPVRNQEILGVQGRYFIPIIPVMMIFARNLFNKFSCYIRNQQFKLAILAILPLVYMNIYILVNFWTGYKM